VISRGTASGESRIIMSTQESRLEALDRSVRVALSKAAPGDTDGQIVTRAKAFDAFLSTEPEPEPEQDTDLTE
jgi:hypothetical protein